MRTLRNSPQTRFATGAALFGVLFVQWVRSSMKEAEREDRRLDLLEAKAAREAARQGR